VLAASLTWESGTATATPTALRLLVVDAAGSVVADTSGDTSSLTVEATVEPGEHTVSVTAVTGAATFDLQVGVEAADSTAERVAAAYEEGKLAPDDAARYSLWAALEPERVPEAYAVSAADPVDELAALQYWDEIDAATRAELAAATTPVEKAAPPSARTAADPTWTDCGGPVVFEVFLTDFTCVAEGDIDNDGVEEFEVIYNVSGASAVNDKDGGDDDDVANGRPDQVDVAVEAFTEAWRHYESLGFRPIDDRIRVVLWSGMQDNAGLALPRWDDGSTGKVTRHIYMDTSFTAYLPRHELFHQFQYEYIGLPDLALWASEMTWWMEATVERTWVDIDNGFAPSRRPSDVVADVLEDRGDGFAEEVTRFRQWTYVLSGQPPGGGDNFGIGFTEEDEADEVNDVEDYWRPVLQRDERTRSAEPETARPRRQEFTLVPEAGTVEGGAMLRRTGAAYVDLDLPGGERQVTVTVRDPDDDIVATLLPFAAYPRLCAPPVAVPAGTGPGDDTLTWVVPADCNSATLVLAKTSRDDDATPSGSDVRWQAAATFPPGATRSYGDPLADVAFVYDDDRPYLAGQVDARSDIVQHTVRYGQEVELAVRTLEPRPLLPQDELSWLIDTNANGGYAATPARAPS